jgi:hypothetical protein
VRTSLLASPSRLAKSFAKTLIGALMMSRFVRDAALSRAILRSAEASLTTS